MYLSKIFIPLRKTANFYLALRAGTGNRNQSTLFYYHVRHYSFHAIPYHKHRDWYRRKFPPFPLFIYVSLILPMIATNCQCPCSAKRSSAVMCQKKRYTLQIHPEPD